MTNYICINGNKTELTEEQLKQLGIKLKKENPFKKVESDRPYYCISANGVVHQEYETGTRFDKECHNVANYCTDKSLVEQRALHETLNRLLWRYSMEHDGDKIDWNNVRLIYKICYSHDNRNFYVDSNTWIQVAGTQYFYAKETAENAIKEVIEPFMKEHPEFKW